MVPVVERSVALDDSPENAPARTSANQDVGSAAASVFGFASDSDEDADVAPRPATVAPVAGFPLRFAAAGWPDAGADDDPSTASSDKSSTSASNVFAGAPAERDGRTADIGIAREADADAAPAGRGLRLTAHYSSRQRRRFSVSTSSSSATVMLFEFA
ncbi:MAG TPA: hypothetical protein VG538_01280 [Vicinamibacterales bacterium]|nr:hypothetical protein [Vicinamibacterales bacterium]